MTVCPLCQSDRTADFHRDQRRAYVRCQNCELIHVPPEFFLSVDEERAVYDRHENDPNDQRYRNFLGRLATPLLQRLSGRQSGLDFGSGPGPTLSVMLSEAGHEMAIYDPFYAPDTSVFNQHYDFITTTETAEHLYRPLLEFERLWSCVRPGGLLAVMTRLFTEETDFAKWPYKADPTHVCFYSIETFHWLATKWSAMLEHPEANVVIFSKQLSQ